MADAQTFSAAELDSLNGELDIFDSGQRPRVELIQQGLHPPLPICSDTLIWGFEILRSVAGEHFREVRCLMIPPCSRAEMLSLALKLENRAGGFSWPEKEKMLRFLADTDRLNDLSPLIENHPDPQLGFKIGTFSALAPALKNLVAVGQIDLKNAARVQSLPEEVFRWIKSSTLTFSQRRQFLNELFEIRHKLGLSDQEIRNTAEQALRGPHSFDSIHRLRFPTLTDLEERYTALRLDLLQGSGVQLKPPPYFEGEAYTVEFAFNSATAFSHKLDALHTLEGRLDALFELLH